MKCPHCGQMFSIAMIRHHRDMKCVGEEELTTNSTGIASKLEGDEEE